MKKVLNKLKENIKIKKKNAKEIKEDFILLLKNNKSKDKIKAMDFWRNDLDNIWLHNFLKKINYDKNVTIISVFGRRRKFLKYYKGKKIFFTGENVKKSTISEKLYCEYGDNLIDLVDLSVGFDYTDNKKFVRFPLWYTYLFWEMEDINYERIKEIINKFNSIENRNNENRKKFVSLIASHDVSGIRGEIYNILKDIGKIECAGNFLKNTDELQKDYGDNKIEYMRNFKFNICPENSNESGYVTEKIFQSIMSGCIPIYSGGGVENTKVIEPEILNQDAFIYYERGKEKELFEKVKLLYTNQEEYERFINIPPFKENAADVIWEKFKELEEKIKNM